VPTYRIRVRGHLDASWSEWLGGLAVHHQPDGHTVLAGPLPDQAALYGLLNKLADLHVALVAVTGDQAE
jgi:hypothetical protein